MNKQLLLIAILLLAFQSLTFSQGSKYAGPYTSSNPISLSGVSNRTISNLEIVNSSGHCIQLTNCSNITIQNCKLGPSKNEGVYLYKCTNVTIVNCTFDHNDTGVFAGASSGVAIMNNDVINVQGPMPRGQMVQFAEVSGGGNRICYNVVENTLGQSYPEDAVSLYKSNGIEGDPIQVVGNWIRGGGPSNSGGGIMTGDMGGSYILVQDNILVNPGQYGITIASGHHISIKDNKIYSKQLPFSNIGLSAYKQYDIETYADTIMNNEVNFTYMDGQLNNMLNDGKCGTIYGWSTNKYNAYLNEDVLPDVIIGKALIQGVTTETPELTTDKKVKIFPNPAYDHFVVKTPNNFKNSSIEVYNISGQKLMSQPLNTDQTEIDTSNLLVGVYIVKVLNDNQPVDQQKVMIRK